MVEKRLYLLIFLIFTLFLANSQDLHYSNYDYNLLYINPAEAGAFLGTVRVQGSHRDQFDAFIEKGYSSQMVQVDQPINLKLFRRGWTGYGISLFSDKSGDLGFKNSGAIASLSYHYPLDKKNRQVISAGVSVGRIQRSMNDSNAAKFTDALLGGGISSDFSLLDQFNEAYSDYSVGLKFRSFVSKEMKYELGISTYHILNAQKMNSFNNQIWRRFNIYGTLDYRINRELTLQPRIFTSFISNFYNANLQCLLKYNFQNKINLGGGLGYRVADALQLLFIVNYKGWDLGLAYDVTLSSASAYNNRQGAFELGIKKIFILNMKPTPTLIDICPRL